MTTYEFIKLCIASFLACLGFSLLYNNHGKNLLISSLCGTFAYAIYLVADALSSSLVVPYFLSGLSIAIYSEVAARIFKAPVTVYLIPGIIPLVPGLTIYRTMQACLSSDLSLFGTGLFNTFKISGAITLGLILASTFFKLFLIGRNKT